MYGRRFFGAHYFGPRYWGDGGGVAATPVSTHRAQYAGIRAAKLKKKKAQPAPVLEPEKITVFGQAFLVDRHRDQLRARGTVRIPGRAVLADNSACDCLYARGKVVIPGVAVLRAPGVDTLSAVGTVRTDEDEALEALFEFMPQLRGMKIKITEDA